MAADDRLSDPGTPLPPLGAETPEDRLARRLRDAHRRVAAARLPSGEKERLARRFMAICEIAKRDIDLAAARLESFLADLDGGSDTPSSRNIAGCD
ncbi:hypothetical protein Ssi03_53160 [Sphaerisporangium siamense]|uniref:Uncharacterized protein n=1 Tax=Sphaerisporangium siamense TaxID=795645 RepID=A0A7W7GBT1_9ACTN|nr:hypothetical protein [Sphaerisporangium siamense]MBB4701306.1 hypothetical protein [Sphaerisporangium siamense]GII87326.1 hypothetical protein Ssi03_53160 [Sphaerisporangium siamense]